MTTVTIEVATREETDARLLRAFSGEQQGSFISFPTIETIREVARRVYRDLKAVHGDIQSLLAVGIIDKTDDGKVIFSYDALHMDFMLKAA